MALDGIEKLLMEKYPKRGNNYCKVNFVRYAADFVVTADSEKIAQEIKALLKTFLKERGLELSDDKTLITNITEGFNFLGWNFRKYRGKLLIKPSKESIQKFVEKISQTIKMGKSWSQERLINKLNPIIRGWTNYHRSVVSSETFRKLDHILWAMLWKWAKRRHHNNPKNGLLTNIGRKTLPDVGISKPRPINYCFYLILKSKDTVL